MSDMKTETKTSPAAATYEAPDCGRVLLKEDGVLCVSGELPGVDEQDSGQWYN